MTFSLIDDQIIASDAEHPVFRRNPGFYDQADGGRYKPGAELEARVRMDIQTGGIALDRDTTGDQSIGDITIYVTAAQLGDARDVLDPGTPLGWTTLRIAPPESKTQPPDPLGPPGDLVVWLGRKYEITFAEPYDETGPLIPSGRRFAAEDRGVAA